MNRVLPKYPIYVPSKNRWQDDRALTAKFMIADGTPFRFVVEPQDYEAYAAKFGRDRLLALPENNRGLIFARNWIWEHAVSEGHERHWQLDDNIGRVRMLKGDERIPVNSAVAFRACEDFTDRYENVALSGMNYTMFLAPGSVRGPFRINAHVYSCTLILNSLPFRYREPANEDVDLCLQALATGWCTIQFNYFSIEKMTTMVVKGGQTDSAYRGDGRLFMARSLERAWPGVVEVDRRFQRPQHVVRHQWMKFDTQLKLKPGVDLASLPPNDYGLRLVKTREIASDVVKRFFKKNTGE